MQKSAQVALVTGGTGGIGTAICRKLYDDGFLVVASYFHGGSADFAKRWQQEQAAQQYHFQIQLGDVSSFDSCALMVQAITAQFGPIQVLVNNAGITQDVTLKKMQPQQWSEVIKTNLDSVFNVTRHVINDMLAKQYGRIINISSINGQKGQFGQTNYSAAKAGIHGFTMALAQEVAKQGITVNTVSPGYVATPMLEKVSAEVLAQIIAQIPVARLAQPLEIAHLVGFLASSHAGFITGANYAINGGQHMQ